MKQYLANKAGFWDIKMKRGTMKSSTQRIKYAWIPGVDSEKRNRNVGIEPWSPPLQGDILNISH